MSNDDKKQMVEQMELHIHDQFSKTYESGFSATITLMCTLLAVLYGYGKVFLHSDVRFNGLCDMTCSLDALLFATMAANIVLTIMKYICLNQGAKLRMEQFIVYAIRCKYYRCRPERAFFPVFPPSYHPFRKEENKIIIGLYGDFIPILCAIQVLVTVGFLWKLIDNIYYFHHNEVSIEGFIEVFALAVVYIICYVHYDCIKKKFVAKYKERCKHYVHCLFA